MIFGLFRRDPSAKWPAVALAPLRLDPAAGALNGLALGAPADAIARFGRPDNRGAARAGEYEYRALGLKVGVMEGRVESFTFSFDDPLWPEFGACTLEVQMRNGGALALTRATQRAALERALGRPERVVDGNDGQTVEFRAGVVWLATEITLDEQRLVSLYVDLRSGPESGA